MSVKHSSTASGAAVAGKIAAPEWNADHVHVPFEVALFIVAGNAGVLGVASSAAGTELWPAGKPTRNKIDLSTADEVRLTATVTSLGNAAAAAIRLSYMTTNVATWVGNTGVAASGGDLIIGAGTAGTMFDTGWRPMAAGAQVDNLYIAAAVAVAFGTTPPAFGNVTAYFR